MLADGWEAPLPIRRYPGPTRFRWLLAAVLVGLSRTPWSDPVGPTAGDRRDSHCGREQACRDHLSAIPSTGECSQHCFNQFLKSLDPLDPYFLPVGCRPLRPALGVLLPGYPGRGDISCVYEVFWRVLAADRRAPPNDRPMFRCAVGLHGGREDDHRPGSCSHYPRTPAEAAVRCQQQLQVRHLQN